MTRACRQISVMPAATRHAGGHPSCRRPPVMPAANPSFRRKPESTCHAGGLPVIRQPTRHSGESRNPRVIVAEYAPIG